MEEKKIQSASEKDLKKIINGMIKKALNDNQHLLKLHRAICEEWYLKTRGNKLEKLSSEFGVKGGIKKEMNEIQKSRVINEGSFVDKRAATATTTTTTKQVNKQEIKMERKRREQELAEQTFQVEIKRKEEQEEKLQCKRQKAWEFYNNQKTKKKGWKKIKNNELNTWLNQLDYILHQKYLRERRYQVQSFYCQPTYYGTQLPNALFLNSQLL